MFVPGKFFGKASSLVGAMSAAVLVASCSGEASNASNAVTITETATGPTASLAPVTITESVDRTVTATATITATERTTVVRTASAESRDVAGAAGKSATSESESNVDSSSTPTSASFEARSGYLAKAIGEGAGLTDLDETRIIDFTIDKIEVDVKCTGAYSEAPENGHFIGVHVAVHVLDAFDPATDSGLDLNPASFTVASPEGETDNNLGSAASFRCMAEQDSASSFYNTPGTKAAGWVVLDSAHTEGALLLTQGSFVGGGGWEWRF